MTNTVRITELDNGLRVISDEMKQVETASAGIWIEAGSRHETAKMNGVSHMLEHMAFKGTRRRSAQAIAEEVENVGGHLNAYTSRENTAYFAKILKEDLGLAIDVVADLVQNAVLDAEELERERGVILQEIHQAQDTPDDVIFDLFQDACFPDQALGRPVLGPAKGIEDMARTDIIDYMNNRYLPQSMVLSAAGNLEHDKLVDMAQQHFSVPNKSKDKAAGFSVGAYKGGEVRESRDIEQVHLMLGFEGLTYNDDDFYAASVMSMILGGGMSSRLFQEVREKRGLVYSVYSFVSSYADTGMFGIYAGTGEKDTAELIPVVCDEIGKICTHITEQELLRAKTQMKASVLMSLESTSSRAEQLARQLMVFGREIPTSETVERIEAINSTSILRVAKRIFASTPTLAALGPIKNVEDYDAVKKRLI
ncbi:MAG: peptidase M16 [Rhodospirillaceae bacterium]|nr:MAG: peptidase M16 [Rhodospirillaceae bacterium]